MKKLFRRLMAVAVAAALTAGMCITASAYTYPSAYWKLHDAWSQAVAAKNTDQVLTVAQQTYDLLMKDPLCADICNNLESPGLLVRGDEGRFSRGREVAGAGAHLCPVAG